MEPTEEMFDHLDGVAYNAELQAEITSVITSYLSKEVLEEGENDEALAGTIRAYVLLKLVAKDAMRRPQRRDLLSMLIDLTIRAELLTGIFKKTLDRHIREVLEKNA